MGIALRYLDPTEMLALSARWLGESRPQLEAIAEVKPLLPRLDEAHRALDSAQKANGEAGALGERRQRLLSQARELDDRHDHAVRALYFALSAVIEHRLTAEAPDVEEVTALEALRDAVLPGGLAITQASYELESAAAARAADAVAADAASQRLLRGVHVLPRTTGLDLLGLWAELGARLGAIELERASLAGEDGPDPKARNGWLNIVATLLSVLDHAHASDRDVRAFRGPLAEACERAQARYTEARRERRPPA